jgi:SAM-dependent methyltransferase
MFSHLLHSPVRAAGHLWRALNERWLRITTVESTPVLNPGTGQPPVPCHADNYAYSTPDYLDLRRILSRAQLTPADVFYDIGCGMGRVVCLAARRRITKAVGIELNPGLAAIARRNGERLRGRRAPIEIRLQDAATADIADGTVYSLFNPFGPDTLREVLARIRHSLMTRPRPIRIIYLNPLHKDVLQRDDWLEECDMLKTFRRLEVRFYRNRP